MQNPAQRASTLVDAGVELSNRGRFQEAAEKFVQALALDPGLAEAHYLLGLIRQQDGRAGAALQSFRAALKIHPRYAEAQARVCEIETGLTRAREAGYEGAVASCRRAIQLNPNDAEPLFHLAWIHAKTGNHALAIQEYRTVLRLDPKFAGVKYELAMAHMDSQDAERAMPLLREVVATEPGHTNARLQLGSALVKKGDCAAAVPMLETAAESPQKHYLLAGCYRKMDRLPDAGSELAKVKQLRKGDDARMQAKYLAALAHQRAEAGELDAAISNYRAALDLVKDSTIAIDLAVALLKKGDAEEVLRLLGGDASPLSRYQMALAYAKLGRADDSRSTLERLVREKPGFVEAWYQLGVGLLALNKHAEAEAALRAATELRPDDSPIRVAWAEALERLGKSDEAMRQRQLAARLPR